MPKNNFTDHSIVSLINRISFAIVAMLMIGMLLSCQSPINTSTSSALRTPTSTADRNQTPDDQFLPANNPSNILLITNKEQYHQQEVISYTIKNNSEESISYYTYGLCNDLGVIHREGDTLSYVTLNIIEAIPELVELKPGQANTCVWDQWGYWLSPDGRNDYVSPGQYQFALYYYPTADLNVAAEKRTVSQIFTVVETKTVIVSLFNAAYDQIKGEIETVYITQSGNGVWLELSPTNFGKLQASGVPIAGIVETFLPNIGKDPLLGEPDVPLTLLSVYPDREPNFYLIQFRGPLQPEWEAALQLKGIETFVLPHHGFSYVYWITPEQAAEIQNLDFIRWAGPFHAAYRLTPNLEKALVTGSETIRISVVIYVDSQQSVENTIKAIEDIGGVFHNREVFRVTPPTETVNFVVPTATISSIAQLQNVLIVEHWVASYLESE